MRKPQTKKLISLETKERQSTQLFCGKVHIKLPGVVIEKIDRF